MKSFRTRLAALLCGAMVLAGNVAQAQDKFVIKFGWATTDSATDPHAVAAHEFKRLVEEKTAGRISVNLFPNRQLGDEKPLLEGMRLGTVDAASITNGSVAQIDPAFQVLDLPFLFPSAAKAYEVLDGQPGQKLGKRLESKGIVVLGYIELGFRHMINNVRPVTQPADVKGVKYRVIQNPLFISMFNALGASPVPMAWGEMFTALQQGAIDGLDSPISIVDQSKIYELAKYYSLTSHSYTAAELLISKRAFDRLPPELAGKVREAAAEAVKKQRQVNNDGMAKSLETIKSNGMQVNEISDVTPFRDAVKNVYADAAPKIGEGVMQEMLAAVGAR